MRRRSWLVLLVPGVLAACQPIDTVPRFGPMTTDGKSVRSAYFRGDKDGFLGDLVIGDSKHWQTTSSKTPGSPPKFGNVSTWNFPPNNQPKFLCLDGQCWLPVKYAGIFTRSETSRDWILHTLRNGEKATPEEVQQSSPGTVDDAGGEIVAVLAHAEESSGAKVLLWRPNDGTNIFVLRTSGPDAAWSKFLSPDQLPDHRSHIDSFGLLLVFMWPISIALIGLLPRGEKVTAVFAALVCALLSVVGMGQSVLTSEPTRAFAQATLVLAPLWFVLMLPCLHSLREKQLAQRGARNAATDLQSATDS
jgi:hypothetical protein